MEGGTSRRELLDIIDQQKEKLTRYETRLKEVVKSYKALAKEKASLETSLKAITDNSNEGVGNEAPSDSSGEGGDGKDGAAANFKSRIGSLTTNLASLSQEKAEIESKFLAERKRYKKEKDELSLEINKLKTNEQSLKSNLEEVKSKLIIEKHDREQEINNNRLMMKEMQKLLADERNLKEKLEEEIFSLKKSGDNSPAKPKDSELHQPQAPRLDELKVELETMKAKLQMSEKQLEEQNNTKAQLRKMQEELTAVRKLHHEQLETAEEAREAAELRAVEIQKQQEQRVVNLEAKLQELSQSLAEYQRLRDHDQNNIDSMRTRIDMLSDENSALAKTIPAENENTNSQQSNKNKDNNESSGEAVETMLATVKQIKESLLTKGTKRDVLDPVFMLPWQMDLQNKCRDLEIKVQNLQKSLKEKPSGSVSSMYEEFISASEQSAQLENYKAKTDVLLKKLGESKSQVAQLTKDLDSKSEEKRKLKENQERETEIVRMENKKKIGVLRIELEEQRSRSIHMMEEKDAEIQRLQHELEKSVEEVFYSPERKTTPMSVPSRKVSCDIAEMSAGANTSGAPLHYIQELSRKEVEVKELRANILQLESTLREIQLNMSTKEEKYQDTIDNLENTVSRLERMTTSEGANLEYLKNVVLTYMLSTDVSSKNHMLKAIGAVLKLSKSEIKRVKDQNAYASWWTQQQKQ